MTVAQPLGRIEDYLRAPRIWWMRSAYAIEVSPWVKREQVEAALLFRGAIVSAHGYIETRLAELAFRSSAMPEYEKIRTTFPYKHGKLLAYLREIFSQPPLQPYRHTAERFFVRFDQGTDLRHLIAHCKMRVESDQVVFEDFKMGVGGRPMHRRLPMTIWDLEKRAWKAVCLSRICQRLVEELEALHILPPLSVLETQQEPWQGP